MQRDLIDYIGEASGLDLATAGRVAVIDAAAAKIGTDRATVYAWLGKGEVPKSAALIALVGDVNERRAESGGDPCTFDELARIAGVPS